MTIAHTNDCNHPKPSRALSNYYSHSWKSLRELGHEFGSMCCGCACLMTHLQRRRQRVAAGVAALAVAEISQNAGHRPRSRRVVDVVLVAVAS